MEEHTIPLESLTDPEREATETRVVDASKRVLIA